MKRQERVIYGKLFVNLPTVNPYQITFQTWNKVASLYQDKFMNLDLYDDTYNRFCDLMKTNNSSVLEIGCGPGNITKYLLTKRPDLKVEGIDVASNMIQLAKENNPTADFKVMDCRELHPLQNKYDAIVCRFCMPYLSKDDCAKLIKDAADLLHNSGIFYFSTIEGNYEKSGFEAGSTGDQAFVYYHTEEFLRNQLLENNFECLELMKKVYAKNENENSVHLIFIGRKK